MELSQQVIPLPMAQRLKELGVKQESLFVHDEYPFDPGNSAIRLKETETHLYWNCPSAFTVAELGVILPQTISYKKTQKASIKISRFNAWTIFYNRHSSGMNVCMTEDFNEAKARGAMLIHLLESNLITIQDINSRI